MLEFKTGLNVSLLKTRLQILELPYVYAVLLSVNEHLVSQYNFGVLR